MREIPGFDQVFINEDGTEVLSYRRYRAGKLLTIRTSKSGRAVVKVDYQYRGVHELVALAYIGPKPSGARGPAGVHVRHLDDDHSNSHWTNLAYGTAKENTADSIRSGRHVSVRRASQTHCVNGHEFTSENTYRPPKGGSRGCKECRRRRTREYRAKR